MNNGKTLLGAGVVFALLSGESGGGLSVSAAHSSETLHRSNLVRESPTKAASHRIKTGAHLDNVILCCGIFHRATSRIAPVTIGACPVRRGHPLRSVMKRRYVGCVWVGGLILQWIVSLVNRSAANAGLS